MFAKEVQAAVLDGRADLAVHSAKDLPSVTVPGLVLAAVPERGDPRDALVGLDARRPAARARRWPPARCAGGRSSRRHRPDLRFVELRGNMQTRLAKAADARRHRRGRRRARPARPGRPDRRARSTVDGDAPAGGPGARSRVECRERRRRRCARCWRAIEHEPDAAGASTPSGPSSPSSAATAPCPAGAHAVIDGDDLRARRVPGRPTHGRPMRATAAGSDPSVGTAIAVELRDRLDG